MVWREVIQTQHEIRKNYREIVNRLVSEYLLTQKAMPEDVKAEWEEVNKKYNAIRRCDLYHLDCDMFFDPKDEH